MYVEEQTSITGAPPSSHMCHAHGRAKSAIIVLPSCASIKCGSITDSVFWTSPIKTNRSCIPSSSMVLSTRSDSNRVCFRIIVAPPCCFLRAKEHMTGLYSFIFFLSKTTVHVASSLIFVNCINLMIFMQQDIGYAGCSRGRVCRMHVVQASSQHPQPEADEHNQQHANYMTQTVCLYILLEQKSAESFPIAHRGACLPLVFLKNQRPASSVPPLPLRQKSSMTLGTPDISFLFHFRATKRYNFCSQYHFLKQIPESPIPTEHSFFIF